jgi:hypothetical protein
MAEDPGEQFLKKKKALFKKKKFKVKPFFIFV